MSQVPEAMSSTLSPGLAPDSSTQVRFQARCMPKLRMSFIRS